MNTQGQVAELTTRYGYWLYKTMVWGLAIQALWATYQSVKLILIDLPASRQIDINFLINDLIIVLFTTVISGGLAINFTQTHNQRTEILHTFVGFAVVILNIWLWYYLNSQNPGAAILPFIELMINKN